jgi:outer membrane protein OmpA-like peptidoglycan-associated protein
MNFKSLFNSKKLISFVLVGGLFSCATPGEKTATGAGIGAGAGAALGALFGSQSGNAGKGALIGAGIGAALGGVIGNRLDKQARELEKIAEVKRTENGIIARLKSDILFNSGSSSLKNTTMNNIDQIADILKKYPENNIAVIGHTDSDGSESYNQSLSERRAHAVSTRLISKGVPSKHLSTEGAGQSQPIESNKTAAGKMRNRRVELVITVDPSRAPKS